MCSACDFVKTTPEERTRERAIESMEGPLCERHEGGMYRLREVIGAVIEALPVDAEGRAG